MQVEKIQVSLAGKKKKKQRKKERKTPGRTKKYHNVVNYTAKQYLL
jgi:hypothetical protein